MLEAVADLGLAVATTREPNAIESLLSIDHIAVLHGVAISDVRPVSAAVDGVRMSDPDAFSLTMPNR